MKRKFIIMNAVALCLIILVVIPLSRMAVGKVEEKSGSTGVESTSQKKCIGRTLTARELACSH